MGYCLSKLGTIFLLTLYLKTTNKRNFICNYSQKDIAKVKTEIEKHLKTTNEINETTETLKKLAIDNSVNEIKDAKSDQHINGNHPSNSQTAENVEAKELNSTR